jgi:hypothetical protein
MKKKKTTGSFLVIYSESCTPHIAYFNSYSAAKKFVAKFYEDHVDNQKDNFVDFIIEGRLAQTYEGWSSYIEVGI